MADGGGLTAPVLTADLVARAVIAAAISFGDDPIAAMMSSSRSLKRVRVAAAGGLSVAGVCTLRRAARVLDVRDTSVSTARSSARPDFDRAELAAAEAATWTWAAKAEAPSVSPPCVSPPPPAVEERPLHVPPEFDEALAPAPSIFQGVDPAPARRGPAGRIASEIGPRGHVPASLPVNERPLRDLVLEALGRGALDSMNIASAIDRKEMGVCTTLTQLEREGLVTATPCDGPRRLRWSLAA